MSDLLSAQDWLDFEGAIGDIADTFFNIDVIVRKYERTYGANYYSNLSKEAKTSETDFNIQGLVVYSKTGVKSQTIRKEYGEMDLSDGYVLLEYNRMVDSGLIDLGLQKSTIEPDIDEMLFRGESYMIIGANEVGPFEDRFALLKIHFRKKLKNG
jgi:hypothetical protein